MGQDSAQTVVSVRQIVLSSESSPEFDHSISGTFKVGMGDTFEEAKMGAFPAGSFAYLDPEMHHYAMASGDVVVQVHGAAPLEFRYVNADDDPSRKK